MNHVTLFGNVGRAPELSYTQSGKPRCKLSLATNERVKKPDGSWGEMTDWHNIVFWGKQAEYVNNNADKGSQMLVSGKVRSRKYTGNDGQDRWVTEIIADRVEIARGTGAPQASGGSGSPHGGYQDQHDMHDQQQQQEGSNRFSGKSPEDLSDDDLPF